MIHPKYVFEVHKPLQYEFADYGKMLAMIKKYKYKTSDVVMFDSNADKSIKKYFISYVAKQRVKTYCALSLKDNTIKWTWPTGSFMLAVFDKLKEALDAFCEISEMISIDGDICGFGPMDNPFYDINERNNPCYITAYKILSEELAT